MSLCNRLPWLVSQREDNMLFVSWPAAAAVIRPLVPEAMELDTYDGQTWVTLIPFRMTGLRLRCLPPLPGSSSFAEIDFLTYVRVRGEPGIFFLRIDADTLVGSWLAPRLFGLPYHHSRVEVRCEHGACQVDCTGKAAHGEVRFAARYLPTGEPRRAREGTLEHFLVERFTMFSRTSGGTLLRGRERRRPRQIQDVDGAITTNTIPEAVGLSLPDEPPLMIYCRRSEMVTWVPAPLPGIHQSSPTMSALLG